MKMMMNALATTAVAASFLAYTAQAQNNGNNGNCAQCLYNHHFKDGTVLIDRPGSYK